MTKYLASKYTAEEILGGTFVVRVDGMPGFTNPYLTPSGDLTEKLAEAATWRGWAAADHAAHIAITEYGEADYWIMADPELVPSS